MFVSIIICTYRRPDHLRTVLRSLAAQTYRDFEVLVVDGDNECEPSRSIARSMSDAMEVGVVVSPKGLTRQRNAGLRAARGGILCLIDDDVEVEEDFLQKIVSLFAQPDMQDVGGLSGYDVLNYPQSINARWRLRRFLGTVPSLEPGAIDRLGNSAPVSFCPPFSGCRPVGFFYGFCMIFRATAISGTYFDEELPTYGGEDRDFSFRVAQRWRLLLCGDLRVRHLQTPQSRDSLVRRTYQTGFGAGRTFAKHRSRYFDYVLLLRSLLCEFLIDCLSFFSHPSWERSRLPFARAAGLIIGVRSYRISSPAAVPDTSS
ncbi:MAG: glycosyltransferase family 2 protein [Candidatus Solibacter sp.]